MKDWLFCKSYNPASEALGQTKPRFLCDWYLDCGNLAVADPVWMD